MRVRSALTFVLVLLALPALAQFDRGQVGGFVRDEQGAVVPGAAVKVTNEQTRLERAYTSDHGGYYVAPALTPGIYEVAVELSGFKKFVQTGVKVDAASNVQVDATLTAGGIQEAVTVVGENTPDAMLQYEARFGNADFYMEPVARVEMQNAPRGFGALETHSQLR